MKSFLEEFLYIHKQKRVRESVMLARIGVSVFLIVACLAAMSFTAYAYFTCTVSSGIMPLQSAHFHADISIVAPDSSSIPLTPTGDGRFQAFLVNDIPYTVTLTAEGTAETGFCVITSDISGKVYCTQQLGIDRTAPNGSRSSMTFTLTVEVSSNVIFFPHWGTSTYYEEYNKESTGQYILQQEPPVAIQITADRLSVQNSAPQQETTTPTTELETVPPTTPPVPKTQATEAPAVTAPAQTESTVPPTTATTVPETTPEETFATEPIESEPEETEPTQPESTETTQPEEITTPTTVPSDVNPTEGN